MKSFKRWALGAALCAVLACDGKPEIPAADHVFLDGKIYTADAERRVALAPPWW